MWQGKKKSILDGDGEHTGTVYYVWRMASGFCVKRTTQDENKLSKQKIATPRSLRAQKMVHTVCTIIQYVRTVMHDVFLSLVLYDVRTVPVQYTIHHMQGTTS
jgi:hypothetical protein